MITNPQLLTEYARQRQAQVAADVTRCRTTKRAATADTAPRRRRTRRTVLVVATVLTAQLLWLASLVALDVLAPQPGTAHRPSTPSVTHSIPPTNDPASPPLIWV